MLQLQVRKELFHIAHPYLIHHILFEDRVEFIVHLIWINGFVPPLRKETVVGKECFCIYFFFTEILLQESHRYLDLTTCFIELVMQELVMFVDRLLFWRVFVTWRHILKIDNIILIVFAFF